MEFNYSSAQRDSILFYPDTGRSILAAIEHITREARGGQIRTTTRLILDHVNVSRNCVTTWLKRLQKDGIIALRITERSKIYQVTLKYLPTETGINLESNCNNSAIVCNRSGIIDPVLYINNIYKTTAEETDTNKATTAVNSTSPDFNSFASGRVEIKTENESSELNQIPDEDEKSLKEVKKNMSDEITDLARIYATSGNKYKGKRFKNKSTSYISKNHGHQLDPIIKEYGGELACEGMRQFMQDDYWQQHELPLFAFIKTPEKWIPESVSDDAGDAEEQDEPLTTTQQPPARPGSFKAGNMDIVGAVVEPINWPRRRAMRRNEACVLFQAVGEEIAMQELCKDFDNKSDLEIESYFQAAVAAFEKKMNRKAPVSSVALV